VRRDGSQFTRNIKLVNTIFTIAASTIRSTINRVEGLDLSAQAKRGRQKLLDAGTVSRRSGKWMDP
jgi:transposase